MASYEEICMKIDVITSFNKNYYEKIGRYCVETWLKYWDNELQLTCYVEEFSIPKTQRIHQIPFTELPKEYFDFQKTKKVGGQERKFAKKSYSFIHAMQHSTADRIIWLDADVLTKKELPLSLLHSILPEEKLSTHLGVVYSSDKSGNPGNWLVPETGFFSINTQHEKFSRFKDEYTRIYNELDFAGLRRKYDNDVYGKAFLETGAEAYDLCADFAKPYKTPFKHSVLGPYLDHYKAKGSKASFVNANNSQLD